jgi:hypothetical protein
MSDMNNPNMKGVWEVLVRTWDGRSVLVWFLAFTTLFVRSIIRNGLMFEQLMYLIFPVLVFLMFVKSRVGSFHNGFRTNMWGLVNVNGFGVFLMFLAFRDE